MTRLSTLYVGFLVLAFSGVSAGADCPGLMTRDFAGAEIRNAELVKTGTFTPSDHSGTTFHDLPIFCRVVGVIRPSADSEIGFELWLPDQWNGRYLQMGNGGFAGVIPYVELESGLRNGFAVASTDDGHTGIDAAWALGHPEKILDFGYRAVHLTGISAKAIINAYYGRKSAHAYFNGCSDGGREALMEAQRYPDDFDGWVVGAPANNWTSLMTYQLNAAQIVAALGEPLIPSQIEALTRAVIARCDAADGIKDGVIEEPLRCFFDPAELLCSGVSDGKCLSRAQVEAVRRIYDDARETRTHASLTPGLQGTRGAENWQWPVWITGPVPKGFALPVPGSEFFSENFWRYMIYNDPKLDFRKLDLLQAFKDARSRVGTLLDSMDPDLSLVRASGKKIIQYHGWADVAIPPQYSITYYEAVQKYLGRDNQDFYRLFMVSGMGHCAFGAGPNVFGEVYADGGSFDPEHNVLAALMTWVETGKAPERVVATQFQDGDPTKPSVRTKPLCPYPASAKYDGAGSSNDARNFVCTVQQQ